MPDHPLGEQLPGIVGRVLAHDPAQQIAAARDRKADRESEPVAEAALVHRGDTLIPFWCQVNGRRWAGGKPCVPAQLNG